MGGRESQGALLLRGTQTNRREMTKRKEKVDARWNPIANVARVMRMTSKKTYLISYVYISEAVINNEVALIPDMG